MGKLLHDQQPIRNIFALSFTDIMPPYFNYKFFKILHMGNGLRLRSEERSPLL